jgi:hypothetical protein
MRISHVDLQERSPAVVDLPVNSATDFRDSHVDRHLPFRLSAVRHPTLAGAGISIDGDGAVASDLSMFDQVPRDATDPVAAHLGSRTVSVVQNHRTIGSGAPRGSDNEETIAPYSSSPVTDLFDPALRETLVFPRDDHEIVTESVILEEIRHLALPQKSGLGHEGTEFCPNLPFGPQKFIGHAGGFIGVASGDPNHPAGNSKHELFIRRSKDQGVFVTNIEQILRLDEDSDRADIGGLERNFPPFSILYEDVDIEGPPTVSTDAGKGCRLVGIGRSTNTRTSRSHRLPPWYGENEPDCPARGHPCPYSIDPPSSHT